MVYTLGMIYNLNNDQVLLQLKDRPSWQKGRYNGVGGKIEAGEQPNQAMLREGLEETGVEADWIYRGIMRVKDSQVVLYKTNLSKLSINYAIKFAERNTKESLCLCFIDLMPENILTNLSFLVPMLADTNLVNFRVDMREQS